MPTPFATVAEYLEALPEERRAQVEELRTIVMDAAPHVTEIIKWNSPSYTRDGEDVLTINAAGKRVLLILHRGTQRAERKGAASDFAGDPEGLLTWHSDIRASLPLGADRAAMVAVVRAWVAG